MDGITDLLDESPGRYPVPTAPAQPPVVVAGTERQSPAASSGRRWRVWAAVAVVVALLGSYWFGRVSAPVEQIIAPATTTTWLPNCGVGADVRCEVETVTRRFISAWRNGEPVTEFVAAGLRLPVRVPRSEITRGPQVSVSGSTAVVLWWTASDGMFHATLENYTGQWRVAEVAE